MGKGRLEAFTDGVIAIIITIMVLELKVPHGSDLAALASSVPVLLAYVLSFVNVGIYWANHHHMLHATDRLDGTRAMGEPEPAVLAVAGAVRHPLDGRNRLHRLADRSLWRRARDGRGQLHRAAMDHRRLQRPQLQARRSARKRSQGQGCRSPCTRRLFRWLSSTRGSRSRSMSQSRSCGSCPIGALKGT